MTTPSHPLTTHALAKARYLADIFAPVTEAQHIAHRRIVDAINTGDLYATVDAMRAARSVGRRGVATIDWREWATAWLYKVNTLILGEQEERVA